MSHGGFYVNQSVPGEVSSCLSLGTPSIRQVAISLRTSRLRRATRVSEFHLVMINAYSANDNLLQQEYLDQQQGEQQDQECLGVEQEEEFSMDI